VLDLGRQFRAAGVPVVAGGLHVGGCLSMLPATMPDLQWAPDFGITLFAGESETRMAGLLRDIAQREARILSNRLDRPPSSCTRFFNARQKSFRSFRTGYAK
jgi:hypothetical protein